MDTDKKVFSRERGKGYGRDDIIEINKADRRKLIDSLEADGYAEIEHF